MSNVFKSLVSIAIGFLAASIIYSVVDTNNGILSEDTTIQSEESSTQDNESPDSFLPITKPTTINETNNKKESLTLYPDGTWKDNHGVSGEYQLLEKSINGKMFRAVTIIDPTLEAILFFTDAKVQGVYWGAIDKYSNDDELLISIYNSTRGDKPNITLSN